MVGYARRNYMVPVPKAEILEQLSEKLLQACVCYGDHRIASREHTVNELYEAEKRHLIALPQVPFSNLETSTGKVDKYFTVVVDKNRYLVPTLYAYFDVNVVLYVDGVEIFYGAKKLHPTSGFTATTNGASCQSIILSSSLSDRRHLTRRVLSGSCAKAVLYALSGF